MGAILKVSIDLTKIDKSKIVDGKNGAKYYNFDVFIQDETNQFGQNVSIANPTASKEEKKTYIGNGKVNWTTGTVSVATKSEASNGSANNEDLPF